MNDDLHGNPLEEEELSLCNYFVDEAGDPTLFKKRNNVIVGNVGCSKFFILGKLEVDEPQQLSTEMENLRKEILSDPYFKGIPSLQIKNKKTSIAFHAKDDLPEVRRDVFRLLMRHSVRFYAVVQDKGALVKWVKNQNQQNPSYRYRENDLYDSLVRELFGPFHGIHDQVHICFAIRGGKDRTKALREALDKAEKDFMEGFGFSRAQSNHVRACYSHQEPCLQAVDYYLWALQRFYEKGEDRYIEMLWNQVGEIFDKDHTGETKLAGRMLAGVRFTNEKPLNFISRTLK